MANQHKQTRFTGLQLIAASGVGMLLGFGLCNAMPDTSSDFFLFSGGILFWGSFILFFVACARVGKERNARRRRP